MVKCGRCGGLMAYEKFYGQAKIISDGDALPVGRLLTKSSWRTASEGTGNSVTKNCSGGHFVTLFSPDRRLVS